MKLPTLPTTKPIKELLPETHDEDVENLCNYYANGIEELVNYGTHILSWNISQPGSDEKLATTMLFRNFLGLIDSITSLVWNYTLDGCYSLLRTSLETYFYLEYLLEKDTDERSLAFIVWQKRNLRKQLKKFDGTSEPAKQLASKYRNDKYMKSFSPYTRNDTDTIFANVQKLLDLPMYKDINAEFERLSTKFNKNPMWYEIYDGPNDLEKLAQGNKVSGLYELYRVWSDHVHGTAVIDGKISREGIDPLRSPKDVRVITLHTFNIVLTTFDLIITKQVPQKLTEYKKWRNELQEFRTDLRSKEHIKFV